MIPFFCHSSCGAVGSGRSALVAWATTTAAAASVLKLTIVQFWFRIMFFSRKNAFFLNKKE
jgi:hypothetical protein